MKGYKPLPSRYSVGMLTGIALLLQSCAVPVPPTGGPADTTPPTLTASEPVSGSVRVDTDHLVFQFSEPIDGTSFLPAFSITPEMSGPVEVGGSSRRVVVRLPEKLRAETTYRVVLDVTLRDQRRVPLGAPITLAFSTGAEMDSSRLGGRMVHAHDGSAAAGVDVLAFASSDSTTLSERPLFRTQTDREGHFLLEYLPSQSFFVVGLGDTNGNRQIDDGEKIAVPPLEWVQADTTGAVVQTPWILTDIDRSSPRVERIRAVTEDELEIRFSERLRLFLDDNMPSDHVLSLTNEGGKDLPVRALWFSEDQPRRILALAEGLTPGSWNLSGSLAVSDSSGNSVGAFQEAFDIPEGLPASELVDVLRWTPDSLDTPGGGTETVRTVWPMENPGVRLTRPFDDLAISFSDTSGAPLPWTAVQEDATWHTWRPSEDYGAPYIVTARLPDQDSTYSLRLQSASPRQMGALGVYVNPGPHGDATIKAYLQGQDIGGRPVASARLQEDVILFERLPTGLKGRAVVFVDQDMDDRWSPGSLVPYVPPEAVRWHVFNERVRARWDTMASDTLSFDPITMQDRHE